MKIIYANLFTCQGVFQGQIGFRECKYLILAALFTTLKYIRNFTLSYISKEKKFFSHSCGHILQFSYAF